MYPFGGGDMRCNHRMMLCVFAVSVCTGPEPFISLNALLNDMVCRFRTIRALDVCSFIPAQVMVFVYILYRNSFVIHAMLWGHALQLVKQMNVMFAPVWM